MIGASRFGMELALLSCRAGFATTLEDVVPGRLRQVSHSLASEPGLRYAASIEEAVRQADLVLDSVPDELESKLEILMLLDRMAPPRTLFATPLAELSIGDLGACTHRACQCVGLRMTLEPLHAEVRYAAGCDPSAASEVAAYFRALGASVVLSVEAVSQNATG